MIPAPLTGQTIGSYRVLEKIGQGGMGAVYLGEHVLIGRKVAVKVLLAEVTTDPQRTRRFFNEARASAQVRHPGIVDVLDFGTHSDGNAYLVMEYLEGESLRERLKRVGAMPEATVRRLGHQMASALAAAHARQIIHRDLKPDNLFLVPDAHVVGGERVKVLDFGVAKLLGESSDSALETRSGALVGSPSYMAPEQARGTGTIDARTDVYAIGCVLFEMVCGRRPFQATGFGEVLSMHMHSPPPSPRQFAPGITAGLEALLLRTLAKAPAERPASMDELARLLDQVSESAPGVAYAQVSAAALAATLPPTRVHPPALAKPSEDPPPGGTLTDSKVSGSPAVTTLGGSAAEATPRPIGSSRRGWIVATTTLVAAGALVLVVRPWLAGSAAPAVPGAPPVAPVLVASPAPPDAAPPDAAPPPADAAPADATPPPPKPRPRKAAPRPKLQRGEVIDE